MAPMSMERMFDDLEGRFDHLESLDMRAMSDELARAERAQVSLADRFRAAAGRLVRVHLAADLAVDGAIEDSGEEWVRLRPSGEAGIALVPMARIALVEGLPQRARPVSDAVGRRPFGLGHELRGIARDRSLVRLRTDAGTCHGRLRAVGADALDLRTSPTGEAVRVSAGRDVLVPFSALVLVQVL